MKKKKKNRKKNKISIFVSIILLIISLIFLLSLFILNILNYKYLLIIIGVVLLFNVFLLLISRRRKILGGVLSIIISVILGIISFYILKTNGILEGFNKNYKTYNYSVVVLSDSDYLDISNLEDETIGYYETSGEECDKSVQELENKISFIKEEYTDFYTMASDLIESNIESMLIEDSYLDILYEELDSDEFEDKVKVIYTFSIIVNISDISKDIDVTKNSFNIYVSGIDTYGTVSSVSRSDVNMVITVNPITHQILLTSIPRDYYVTLHGTTGYKDKLTHAGLYGVDMSIQTIEDLLDIEINYYVKVNFTSIIDIVDALGGVSVYSEYSFTSVDGYYYTTGYNTVSGEEALSFVRERKAFSTGDRQRIKNQQALIDALFRKCTSTEIIKKYNSLLNSLEDSFVTNMPSDRLTSLIKMQLSNNYSWTITTNSLTGTDSSNYTYSMPSVKSYVMEPDEESVSEAREMINAVIDGEVYDDTYSSDTSNSHNVTSSSSNSSSSNSSSSSSNSSSNNNSNTNSTTNNDSADNDDSNTSLELEVSLYKTSISFYEGEENGYIYYNPIVTYGGVDVLDEAVITYNVSGAVFYNYSDLISYVSNLTAGTYTIVYNITYNGEVKSLSQTVIINEVDIIDEDVEESEETVE